jgi:NhaA family Na+:H+ antiporter
MRRRARKAIVEPLRAFLHAESAGGIVLLVAAVLALANTGVDLGGGVLADAAGSRLAWAVAAGLVVGKILGIAGVTLIARRTGTASLPPGVSAGHVWGLAALAGIGFTVSLFIAELAYADPVLTDFAKVGLFAGSAVSAALGVALLLRTTRHLKKATT